MLCYPKKAESWGGSAISFAELCQCWLSPVHDARERETSV